MKIPVLLFVFVCSVTQAMSNTRFTDSLVTISEEITTQKEEIEKKQVSVEKHLLGLQIFPTGINYETKLATKHTFSVQAQLGYSFAFGISKTYFSNGTSKISSSAYIAIIPQVVTNYRFYYNLEKRERKGKNTGGNSGNYFTIIAAFGFKPAYSNYPNKFTFATVVGPAWGLHRTFKKGVDLNFSIGLGYGFDNGRGSYLAPISNFSFGYIFIPKRQKAVKL